MKRYVLLAPAGVALLALLGAPDESDGCWRRRGGGTSCPPAYDFGQPTACYPDTDRNIGNEYPTTNQTDAKNDDPDGNTFTACGCIDPPDAVYGQIFSDSNDIPDQVATPPLNGPNGSGTGGPWIIQFSKLTVQTGYMLRISGTGFITQPQSQDCPFDVIAGTHAPCTNPASCSRPTIGIPDCRSWGWQAVAGPVFVDSITPDVAAKQVVIRGRVVTTLTPRHTHGEVFRVRRDDKGRLHVDVYKAASVNKRLGFDSTILRPVLWVTVTVPVGDLAPGMRLQAALGCIPFGNTGVIPRGYANRPFDVPH
jgi:hypothetical protein